MVSPISAGRNYDVNPGCGHGLHLVGCGALPAADDGSGMAHAAAGRRGLTGDKADHRLLHVLLDELGRGLFCRAADLADHDDGLGFRIAVEQAQRIDMSGADNRIATNADGCRLADAALRELVHRLIGQRAGAGHNAHRTLFMNTAGHDADFCFAGRNNAGAVRTDEPRLRGLELGPHLHHVQRRNAFGDADDERNARVLRFKNGIGGKRRRHKNHGRVGACGGDSIFHGVKDRPALVLGFRPCRE